ncbi:MAG TPA: VOC family protein [Bacteroidota bacterium]|nr:VOC family protein [Bacteroidota bacterium]
MLKHFRPIAFVATADPSSSREFYERILGLEFISGDQFALVFDLDGTPLRIQVVEKVNPHPYTALGWNVSDIRKEVVELTGRGIQFERYEGMNQDRDGIWRSPSGAQVAWFKDPDGNILSITQL